MGSTINWQSYNRSLINRGKITFWFSPDVCKDWYADPTGKPGAQYIYSDTAIEVLNMIRFRFDLKLRCTQGFGESLVKIMNLKLEIPHYSTISRRLEKLDVQIENTLSNEDSIHVVVDATGLKVFGEGEWKVRQHGYSKRRTWIKLHLGVDESSSQIVGAVVTENDTKDSEVFEDLIDGVDQEITQVSADGAYDSRNCYEKAKDDDFKLVTPPRKGAKIKRHGNSKEDPDLRDQHIREIKKVGRSQWKKNNSYHRRSISETAMYRFKSVLGDKLSSRTFERIANEVFIKCQILNKMPVPSVIK